MRTAKSSRMAPAMVKTQHLIDCHIHLNNYHETSRRPTTENIKDLLDKMDQHGVDHAVRIGNRRPDDHDRVGPDGLLDLLWIGTPGFLVHPDDHRLDAQVVAGLLECGMGRSG